MDRPAINKEMIEKVVNNLSEGFENATVKSVVRHYRYPMDGYELAIAHAMYDGIELERDEVDTLDLIDGKLDQALKIAELDWFDKNKIQPPIAVGAFVKINDFEGKPSKGQITGICDYSVAKYLVKPIGHDDEKSGYMRRLIKFEDAVLAD